VGHENKDLIIFDRAYQLCKWLYPAVGNYPRGQRYILGERTTGLATEILLMISQANAEWSKTLTICGIVLRVRQLKTLLRLAMELKYLSFGQYEHAVGMVDEVGRLAWGWLKATLDKNANHNFYLGHLMTEGQS